MSGEGRKQISWVDGCAVTGGTVGRGCGGMGTKGREREGRAAGCKGVRSVATRSRSGGHENERL